MKLAKMNTGNAVHIAHYLNDAQGKSVLSLICGTGDNARRTRIHSIQSFDISKVTCKKCLKYYGAGYDRIKDEEPLTK